MSNDNMTQAEVQPGGRVRLGDLLPPCPFCGHSNFDQWPCEYIDASGANVVRCAHCHAAAPMKVWHTLSAHPSPGGQGDALLEEVARFLDYSVGHDPWPNIRRAYGDAWWEPVRKMRDDLRALAARQPVGEPVVVAHRYIQRHQSAEHSAWLSGDADETYVEAERQGLGRIERAYAAPPAQQPAIPEGWALVDLAEYTVLPQIPTTAMMDAGWPIGEQITDQFDVKGAYADLIAEHEPKGEGIIHGPSQPPAQAVDLGKVRQLIGDLRALGVKESTKNDNAGFVDLRCYWALLGLAGEIERSMADSQAVGK